MRLIEAALIAALGGALVVGAYQAGRTKERDWWRAEIAAKSARVQEAIKKLATDSAEFDATLLQMIGDDDAKLAAAEARIAELSKQGQPPVAPAVVDPGDPCRPVPASCLRRSGQGDRPARGSASGQ